MRITLKNLSVSDRLTEETLAFSADVYVDGKKVGTAMNRGNGGCTRLDIPRETVAAMDAFLGTTIHTVPGTDLSYPEDAESFIHSLAWKMHDRKKLVATITKRMRDAVVFGTPEGLAQGHYSYYPFTGGEANRVAVLAYAEQQNPGAMFADMDKEAFINALDPR